MPPQRSASQASSVSIARARELRLEVARDLDDRRPGRRAIGDARDAALGPALGRGLAVLERRRLQPRRVEVLHLVAGDDAALEAADAGIVARARDVALLRERGREEDAKASVARTMRRMGFAFGEMWAARGYEPAAVCGVPVPDMEICPRSSRESRAARLEGWAAGSCVQTATSLLRRARDTVNSPP